MFEIASKCVVVLIVLCCVRHSHAVLVTCVEKSAILGFIGKAFIGKQKPFLHTRVDDIIVEDIEFGITNYCYKVYDKQQENAAVFLKHSKDFIKGWGSIPLTSERLQFEYEGLLAFSKYSGEFIPKVLVYDGVSKYLVNEWLEGYVPLRKCFIDGTFDASYARKMGTLMGRSHARTHRGAAPNKVDDYCTRFSNIEHIELWRSSLFAPLKDMLKRGELSNVCDTDSLLCAVERIETTYYTKKEALVHGDLNCNNVLIQQTNNEDKEGFKVVDFEKCFYGPCGLDLGLFLSNYLWYYAVHANPSVRRSLVSGVSAVIEAYKSAFIVQLLGVLGKANQQSDVRPEALFEEILRDTCGFMGIYPLFLLAVIPDVAMNIWPIQDVKGMKFGNTLDRRLAVRNRQLRMCVKALEMYQSNEPVTLQRIASVLLSDDQFLTTAQLTEFWF